MAKKKWRPRPPSDLNVNGIYFHAMLLGKNLDAVSWATRLVMGKNIVAQEYGITKVDEIDCVPINNRTAMAYAAAMAMKLPPSRWKGKVFCHDSHIRNFFVTRNPIFVSNIPHSVRNGLTVIMKRFGEIGDGGNRGSNLEACVMICQAQLDLRRKT